MWKKSGWLLLHSRYYLNAREGEIWWKWAWIMILRKYLQFLSLSLHRLQGETTLAAFTTRPSAERVKRRAFQKVDR